MRRTGRQWLGEDDTRAGGQWGTAAGRGAGRGEWDRVGRGCELLSGGPGFWWWFLEGADEVLQLSDCFANVCLLLLK